MRAALPRIGVAIWVILLSSPAMAQAPTEAFKTGYNVQEWVDTPFSQFKTWGHLEIGTIWERKPDFNTGRPWAYSSQNYNDPGFVNANGSKQGQDITWRHVAERFRIHFQYGDPKTVRAVLGFEANSQDWGEQPGGGTAGNLPPSGGSGPYGGLSNHMGVYQTDQVQLGIMWAFLEFMVPGTPVPVQVAAGMQRFMIGGRLWMQGDAPGLKVRAQFSSSLVDFFWWRQNDRARNVYQVNDFYGFIYQFDQKIYNFYAWAACNNDLYDTTTRGAVPPISTIVPNFPATTTVVANHPYWVAAGGGFRPGNFDFSGQFIYNGGKMGVNRGTDYTYQAYALEFLARYRIGPGMFAGLEYFYASGNDADKKDKINTYTYPLNSESASIFGNDRTVFFWANAVQMGYYQNRQQWFNGMSYYRGNFEYSPASWVRLNLNYLYIEDTSRGTPGPGKIVNGPIGSRQDLDKRKIGQEINLITILKIYTNFWYRFGVAYFLPGDIYDVPPSPGIPGKNAEAAFALITSMLYAF